MSNISHIVFFPFFVGLKPGPWRLRRRVPQIKPFDCALNYVRMLVSCCYKFVYAHSQCRSTLPCSFQIFSSSGSEAVGEEGLGQCGDLIQREARVLRARMAHLLAVDERLRACVVARSVRVRGNTGRIGKSRRDVLASKAGCLSWCDLELEGVRKRGGEA